MGFPYILGLLWKINLLNFHALFDSEKLLFIRVAGNESARLTSVHVY